MLTDRELALIMTALKLAGKGAMPSPGIIEQTFDSLEKMAPQIRNQPDLPGEFYPGPSKFDE